MGGNNTYGYRACRDHFHVTCGGDDLVGGYCHSEADAATRARLLNDGADMDDVLGDLASNLFPHLLVRHRTPEADNDC